MSAITLPSAFPVVGIPLFATFALNASHSLLLPQVCKTANSKIADLSANSCLEGP